MKKIATLLFGILVVGTGLTNAQSKYWITLKDKPSAQHPSLSPRTLSNRQSMGLSVDETDFPLNPAYLQALSDEGVRPLYRSRWLNAVSAELTPDQVQEVKALSFVKELVPIDRNIVINSIDHDVTKVQMAPVMSQIQAEVFGRAGMTAKNVTIGVIDAGFFGADSASALKQIFHRNGIKDVRDYVNTNRPRNAFFGSLETLSDFHGTEVMAAISGHDPNENIQYGLATDATFYLARTDHGAREFRGEEDNWIAAMEWMDSLGVRIINTSLGYAKGFTNPKENYQPDQMDGHTSLISKAAQLAADKKGILVIVSAGNEGDDRSWRIISTPADAQGVLAVGATNNKVWNRIGYSSIGPEFLPYLKPNVSCFSLYGTSLSAPVITGFAACLMQANPKLTNKELISIIEKSSHLYPYGNNYIGYGVPQASRALALAKGQPTPSLARSIKVSGKTYSLPLAEYADVSVSIFHKKDDTRVLQQESMRVQNGAIVLRRTHDEKRTTVDLKKEVVEIIWQ
ncbi:S8 family serine peptidase [Larkinella knui]|uniref:Peptidase S8 n=1 Tax=Larkinella knui TaxID=2025310 RepID=A0A3P1CVH8_9BACT|nr:S8 family serine peptidase [Larkinella knui]RRB17377.1 peptidase S8 [Larkinella knui]